MSKLTVFTSATLLSVLVAGSLTTTAYAWHPKGQITKSVQNITTSGPISAADTAGTAISAKPGDILQYTIIVTNTAAAAEKQYNDLAFGQMTDTLPAGVELVADPSIKTIKESLPTILPGSSVTKQYKVKVTAAVDGKLVENIACYTADSVVKDNPQKGCDSAFVKVTVPVTPTPTPTPTPNPVVPSAGTGAAPVQPTALPSVGAGNIAAIAGLVSTVFGYATHSLILKRRVTA